ncbi:gliding motility-associated C-terminal domain-containing protein [Flavobacterium sp.]|uniref:gliding motility-associated C-terminal domain-containing protein n=1 Tax=Flavobacterium sp. TaxID=239 RepID=UPI0037BF46C8
MNLKLHYYCFSIILLSICSIYGQNVALYNQFNGRYDFTFIGNTMNVAENTAFDPCVILTSSAATYNLNPGDVVESAYLYWAGSGPGDFNVNLNGTPIVAERTFALTWANSGLPFFSAFANVTSLVSTTGSGSYTLSNLDVSSFLNPTNYCVNGTNFAGWAIVIVYRNDALPLNQLNIYDGLQSVPTALTINLSSLNVIDNADAKIGFVAWEGDRNIAVGESLTINGNVISNPPLNPANNAFNGTNSLTGSTTLYNMDLDIYNIENNIEIGDSSALIQLTSSQDFVMINAVVTKLNSQLPDATITIDEIIEECNSRLIQVNFTVYNTLSTNELQSGTPIAIYANGEFIQYTETTLPIPIDGSWSSQVTIEIPDTIPDGFTLLFVVDDDGTGTGIVTELLENNNTDQEIITFNSSPSFNELQPIISCNQGLTSGTFDFGNYDELVLANPTDTFIGYYESNEDAENDVNAILNTTNYLATATPKEIFIRVENENCFAITSFLLNVKNCPPTVYNYISPNNDNYNETFFIKGLRDIFINFELEVYNRWGRLVWQGNNQTNDWDGFSTKGFKLDNELSPKGTYYYLLFLNDPDYPQPLTGFLYLEK